ncbi:PAS domain S-box-containing protein [Haloplanus vescus]|uniref:histidine kinase n=1 Tax=Haloplanus vescus TaxID=555874 RepID=A0A1H3WJN8_9EURY|nr:PAS domain S-box protein [Haloplanus vescus]SDZ87343.1 PAS domain S-box-containing protein [Haloplanus vescus]
MSTDSPIRVLHVDDEPGFADLVADFLEREDSQLRVQTAPNAEVGMDRLADASFDCIVSDYDMPGKNGLQFLREVRDAHPELPFILFTGKGSEEIASEAISAGVTDYLEKEAGSAAETGQYAVLANRIRNAVDQYRSQRDLKASQQRLSLFVEQSSLGVIEYNDEFEIVRINEAGEEILGYSEAELRGETWEKIVADDSYESVEAVTSALAEAEGGYHSIDENVRKDGEHIVCEWHNRVVTDEDGEVVAVFSQFQDVTERHERRRRIEALHEATRSLMGASTREAVAELSVETARDVLGLPMNSVYLYDDDRDALVPTATTDEALELIGEAPTYDPGESLSWDAFRDGKVRVFEDVSTEPGRYNDDTAFGAEIILPLGEHGVMYVAATEPGAFDDADITLARTLAANAEEALSRIERERTLRESQRWYRTLVENFPDGAVFLFNEDLEYILAGGTELSSVGPSSAGLEGATPHDLFPADIADELADNYRAALQGERHTFEQEYQNKEYRIQTLPVRDGGDEITTGIAVSQNVTEQKRRERELARQNDRLEEFASVVSHDLRNPLNVADGHLEILRDDIDSEHLDAVSDAHERMNELIDDLLSLARNGEEVGTLEPVDLARCVEQCWNTVETGDARIEIQTEQTIRVDRSRLQQLVENLVRNSVEHGTSDGAGRTGGESEAPVVVTVGDLEDGFYVADDGVGVPEADRASVFDAGYTTSEDGTGFGLSIVKEIADAHGWAVRLTDSADGGARFEFTGVETAD